MTREEAISLLRQVKEAILNSNSWDETTNEPITDSFDMAIKALEDSRWIPIEERLPEKEGEYLVSAINDGYAISFFDGAKFWCIYEVDAWKDVGL